MNKLILPIVVSALCFVCLSKITYAQYYGTTEPSSGTTSPFSRTPAGPSAPTFSLPEPAGPSSDLQATTGDEETGGGGGAVSKNIIGSGSSLLDKINAFLEAIKIITNGSFVGVYFGAWYNWLFPLAIAIGVFGIIGAGYTYMTSQGNPEKVQEASSKLTSSILGIIFIVLSLTILQVIMRTLL